MSASVNLVDSDWINIVHKTVDKTMRYSLGNFSWYSDIGTVFEISFKFSGSLRLAIFYHMIWKPKELLNK